MRIWDLNPGYLDQQSLLDECQQLQTIVSILLNRKAAHYEHPETARWKGYGWALRTRYLQIKAEMQLMGYPVPAPIRTRSNPGKWPSTYVEAPREQIRALESKYKTQGSGRIRLPRNAQEAWAQHKYSVMARSLHQYKVIGKMVAGRRRGADYSSLLETLTAQLRQPPTSGRLRNALEHMWGHVSQHAPNLRSKVRQWSNKRLLQEIQRLCVEFHAPYLNQSTALSELAIWLPSLPPPKAASL